MYHIHRRWAGAWGSSGIRSSGLSQHWEIVPSWLSQVLWMAANLKDCTSVIWSQPPSSKSSWQNRYSFSFFWDYPWQVCKMRKGQRTSLCTSKAESCWCYDLMLEKTETSCAQSLSLASEGREVEKAAKVTEETWKDERESLSVLSAFVTSIIPIHLLTQLPFLPLHFQCNWGFNLLRQWQNRLYFLFYCICSGYTTCLH